MLRKFSYSVFIGFAIVAMLAAPTQLFADYFVHIHGNSLVAGDETNTWFTSQATAAKGPDGGGRYYYAPVQLFSGYYVKAMSVAYMDSDTTGYIRVRLYRRHFPSGTSNISMVAEWTSSDSGAPGFTKGHVASITGAKYIDTTYFGYFIEVYFSDDNSDGGNMFLYQIRIQYGS